MNLENINSVQDLINMNDKVGDSEELVETLTTPIYKEHPSVGRDVILDILENLQCLHDDMVQGYIEDNDAENAAIWQNDSLHITSAIAHIRNIQFWVT